MGQLTAKLEKTFPIPEGVKPKQTWGRFFDSGTGFSLRLPKGYSMSVFVDHRLKLGDQDRLTKYLSRDQIVARCLSCVGESWELHSEPTGPSAVGLVMYTGKGKALAAGTGQVVKNGDISFSLSTLYEGITNRAKVSYKCTGTGKSDGSWEVS